MQPLKFIPTMPALVPAVVESTILLQRRLLGLPRVLGRSRRQAAPCSFWLCPLVLRARSKEATGQTRWWQDEALWASTGKQDRLRQVRPGE